MFDKIVNLLSLIIPLLIPEFKNPNSVHPIKETDEMLVGLNEVSLALIKAFRDGFQIADIGDIYTELTKNEDVKAKIMAAYDKYEQIPAEISDIDGGEGLQLINTQIQYVPKIISNLKKPEAVS